MTVSVDALPDVEFHGMVESITPGTGANFSLIPPQNATGNFTKIVQRVPVRIRLDKQQGNIGPAGTTATVVITGKEDRDVRQANFFQKLALRLREFG